MPLTKVSTNIQKFAQKKKEKNTLYKQTKIHKNTQDMPHAQNNINCIQIVKLISADF